MDRLDLGRALAAIALVVTSLRFGLVLRIAAVVTALAMVAAGVLLVRSHRSRRQAGPSTKTYASLRRVAISWSRSIAGTGTLQGHKRSNGDEVWKSESFGLSDVKSQPLGDAVLVYSDSERRT